MDKGEHNGPTGESASVAVEKDVITWSRGPGGRKDGHFIPWLTKGIRVLNWGGSFITGRKGGLYNVAGQGTSVPRNTIGGFGAQLISWLVVEGLTRYECARYNVSCTGSP